MTESLIGERGPERLVKSAGYILMSDEAVVDYQIGTAEQQQAAALRLEAQRAQIDAMWRALPRRVRIVRRVRHRLNLWRDR